MKLHFKQRFFSWFDSYDIYDESGRPVFTVKGQLAWGHCLKIFNPYGQEIGTVKERILTFLPQFELYLGNRYMGCIRKEFSLFHPRFTVEMNGWQVEGDIFGWDYRIMDSTGRIVASLSKELFNWTDTYTMNIADPADAVGVLMLVLAIDAEKCDRND